MKHTDFVFIIAGVMFYGKPSFLLFTYISCGNTKIAQKTTYSVRFFFRSSENDLEEENTKTLKKIKSRSAY